ncbi:MAG: hypothetical protein AAFR58_02515 [Cyanobacteria bacterium J06627_28]
MEISEGITLRQPQIQSKGDKNRAAGTPVSKGGVYANSKLTCQISTGGELAQKHKALRPIKPFKHVNTQRQKNAA